MSPRKDAMSMSPREMGDRRVTLELFFHAFMTLITTSCAADQIDSISDPTVTTYPMATNAPEMTPTIPPTIVELASLSPEEMQTLVDRAPLVQKLVNGEVKSENISFNWGEKTASVKTEILEATYTLDTIHQATVEIAGKPVEVTFVGGVMLDLEGKFVGLAKMDRDPMDVELAQFPWFTRADGESGEYEKWVRASCPDCLSKFAGREPVGTWGQDAIDGRQLSVISDINGKPYTDVRQLPVEYNVAGYSYDPNLGIMYGSGAILWDKDKFAPFAWMFDADIVNPSRTDLNELWRKLECSRRLTTCAKNHAKVFDPDLSSPASTLYMMPVVPTLGDLNDSELTTMKMATVEQDYYYPKDIAKDSSIWRTSQASAIITQIANGNDKDAWEAFSRRAWSMRGKLLPVKK
ncbi:MAG: hypothetical protein WCG44_03135 [bacterium]